MDIIGNGSRRLSAVVVNDVMIKSAVGSIVS